MMFYQNKDCMCPTTNLYSLIMFCIYFSFVLSVTVSFLQILAYDSFSVPLRPHDLPSNDPSPVKA